MGTGLVGVLIVVVVASVVVVIVVVLMEEDEEVVIVVCWVYEVVAVLAGGVEVVLAESTASGVVGSTGEVVVGEDRGAGGRAGRGDEDEEVEKIG